MSKKHTLYGWHLSYYTGKVYCYLRYKKIPFEYKQVNLLTLAYQIKKKTGAAVMPAVTTPEGDWLQDSSVIIDHFEERYPNPTIHPRSPVQLFASYFLEAWGDEWWVPIAMHTRWSYPENYALFEKEAGQALLPRVPVFFQRRAVAFIANRLRGMLHRVGVRPEQFAMMNEWSQEMLALLDRHFEQQPFLLGNRPTLADFGLVATMYGHLGRDPWPARVLVAPHTHVRAWIDRMANPPVRGSDQAAPGTLADDQLAPTLTPIFRSIFTSFLPMLEGINRQVCDVIPTLAAGKALPRTLRDIEIPLGTHTFRRAAIPFSLWMAQRTLNIYHAMRPDEQLKVKAWLKTVGGERFLELNIPRLRQQDVHVIPE
ncbi:MAG TPA: glutathione S-transferase family protein [Burkholderiaceae bacterium]|nr:glutathione S-transferase family protein [Burkholderiaceae bacterium]